MIEISELGDEELKAYAREWRLRALRGEREARGPAHELEREIRRRAALQTSSDLAVNPHNSEPQTQQPPAGRSWLF